MIRQHVLHERLLGLTQQTLKTREESLRLTQLRFDNGVSSKLDLQQAVSLVEQAADHGQDWLDEARRASIRATGRRSASRIASASPIHSAQDGQIL